MPKLSESPPREVLVVTGEASGEHYAAQVIRAYAESRVFPAVHFVGSGGDAMREAGGEIIEDVSHLAAIGPFDAMKLGWNYLRFFRHILYTVKKRNIKVALLVDFPDFNLFLVRFLKKRGLKVLYYISPTVWAWRKGRMKTVKKYVDHMLCIFPFEEEMYRRIGVRATYVGHPMVATLEHVDARSVFFSKYNIPADSFPIAVLPGSRTKEIHHLLPPIIEAITSISKNIPRSCFLIPTPSREIRSEIEKILDSFPASIKIRSIIRIIDGDTTNCLSNSRIAIVKSGTSTLQSAVAGTPFVMVYKTAPITWKIGQLVLSNKYFCIVNLIAGREVVPELLQEKVTGDIISKTLLNIFSSKDIYERMKEELKSIRDLLGSKKAPATVAYFLANALRDTERCVGGKNGKSL